MTTTSKKLLLVEDNDDHAELARISFQESNLSFDISHVRDGEEAIHFLKRTGKHGDAPSPEVVLLDINLPKINGREVLEFIRKDEKLKDLPVVVFSTSDNEKELLWAKEMNARFTTKSFDFKEVTNALKAVI